MIVIQLNNFGYSTKSLCNMLFKKFICLYILYKMDGMILSNSQFYFCNLETIILF